MLKRLFWTVVVVFAVVGLAATGGAVLLVRGGIGSRAEPGRFETRLARSLRSLAIPRDARSLRNPVSGQAQAIDEGMHHFADHCALCHGNDGSGQTEMGRGLYPRPPDLRQARTQQLTDGELFYIIENGVKLTGMPAWGTAHSDDGTASWNLVHFIRRLPHLTAVDLDRMRALNPRTTPKAAPPHRHD